MIEFGVKFYQYFTMSEYCFYKSVKTEIVSVFKEKKIRIGEELYHQKNG